MFPFDFAPRTRFVHAPNSVERLGELAAELGCRRALVVSDPGIVKAGHTQHGRDALEKSGITTQLFDGVGENPTTAHVKAGLAIAKEFTPDLIVGLGGGSSMDCAKGINFLLTNGGQMRDYWGIGKATKPLLPMIAVPTTSGTGSEAQSFALISDAVTHVKMACGDKKATFRIAILDPTLTVTQPRIVTALTGIDALSHAIESYVTRSRSTVSQLFAREAFRLLAGNLRKVLDEPADLTARGAMQVGACFAGLAIENSMLGAAHALANPLTAKYGIAHGQAIAIVLPHVIRFNGAALEETSGEGFFIDLVSEILDWSITAKSDCDDSTSLLASFVSEHVKLAQLETRMRDCGVAEQDLTSLATEAAKQWTAEHNPRKVNEATLLELYRSAW
jgi:alcohol dehydrogenase